MKSESELNQQAYMFIAVVFLVQFLWYHVTLPGSYLSLEKKKHPKPSAKTSLTSYLTYLLPMLAVLYLLSSRVSSKSIDCKMLNEYVSELCSNK